MSEPQVMILTGCASGIGQHLAGVLAAQGHRLIVTDINEEGLRAYAQERAWSDQQVLVRRLDVRDATAWPALIELAVSTWGRLDVLMNIAGLLIPGDLDKVGTDMIDRHIDINTKGVMYGSQAAACQMIKQGHGHIINIASLAGLAPLPGWTIYNASKFAVRGFTLALAMELRPKGVYVTVICPDGVQTPLIAPFIDRKEGAFLFSGARILTVHDIEEAVVNKALKKRPIEITIPYWRGLLCKLACVAPNLSRVALPLVEKLGARQQKAWLSHTNRPK